jgi:hypothetical protein
MLALKKVLSLRRVLALLSHSHDVTGIEQAIFNRTKMLGKYTLLHNLMAWAGEETGSFSA